MAYGSTWYMLPNLIIELKKYAFVQWIDITTSRSYMLSISVLFVFVIKFLKRVLDSKTSISV